MSSNTIDIDVDSMDILVLDLKEKISSIKETTVDTIRLIFSGKILDDDKSLNFYKVEENLTIICLIKKITAPKPQVSNEETVPLNIPTNNTENGTGASPLGGGANPFGGGANPFGSGANPFGGGATGGIPTPENLDMMRNMLQNPQVSQMMGVMMQNPQMRDFMINNTLQNLNIPADSPMRPFYINMLNTMFDNPEEYINLMSSISPEQMQNFANMQASGQEPNMENLTNMMNGVNINSSNTENSTDPPNTNINDNTPTTNLEELREKYADQIEQIKNMGFEDESKIIEVLSQSSGSVSIALNKLLS